MLAGLTLAELVHVACTVAIGCNRQAVTALGAGELLVNCIDADGSKAGFDLDLMNDVCAAVTVPVIASSGAGAPQHFSQVFHGTRVEAALAAGIFHRGEVTVQQVKEELARAGIPARSAEAGTSTSTSTSASTGTA